MSGIKFYSEQDMACGWELEEVNEKINTNAIDKEWNITDVLEFYNILKYISIKRFSDYIVQKTKIDIVNYESLVKKKIGVYIGSHKDDFISLYDGVDWQYTDDFFELIEEFKIYQSINVESFRMFLEKESVHVHAILKHRKLTGYFDEEVKRKLLSDVSHVDEILSKYLKETELFLPTSLNELEIMCLFSGYIDSPLVNINILRNIINFPPTRGLNIPDKIKLQAIRREKKEEEKVFNEGVGFESSVRISYPIDQEEAIISSIRDMAADIKVSRRWLEENIDYPTLWNNFIYLFEFVDESMRLTLVSKKSESSALESLFRHRAEYLYPNSPTFRFKEMLSSAKINSYLNVLNDLGVRLEDMIEWFFSYYLKHEFQIDNFVVKMPSSEASYFEKCRTILPEIDRVFKQYNSLIEEGTIDQELIQLSSSSVKIKDIKSYNDNKYVYSSSDWYNTASFLLFSDQSGIFYLKNRDRQFKNFFELIISKRITISDFQEHQLRKIQWLVDNEILYINNTGCFWFVDQNVIYILAELYYKEVISYWHCDEHIQKVIDEYIARNLITVSASLFSINEQDYFDYFLNKAKFTNGYDIRNKYLHGTNAYDERQSELDYYFILKLFVIIVIKINDDLSIRADKSNK